MTSAQVVETSVTNNSSFQNYPHPDDHTIRTTDTPGFKPFTINFTRLLVKKLFVPSAKLETEVCRIMVEKKSIVLSGVIREARVLCSKLCSAGGIMVKYDTSTPYLVIKGVCKTRNPPVEPTGTTKNLTKTSRNPTKPTWNHPEP